MVNQIENLDELEAAIHYLKEAQQLDEQDDESLVVLEAKLDMINRSMEQIVDHVEDEHEKMFINVNRGP